MDWLVSETLMMFAIVMREGRGKRRRKGNERDKREAGIKSLHYSRLDCAGLTFHLVFWPVLYYSYILDHNDDQTNKKVGCGLHILKAGLTLRVNDTMTAVCK